MVTDNIYIYINYRCTHRYMCILSTSWATKSAAQALSQNRGSEPANPRSSWLGACAMDVPTVSVWLVVFHAASSSHKCIRVSICIYTYIHTYVISHMISYTIIYKFVRVFNYMYRCYNLYVYITSTSACRVHSATGCGTLQPKKTIIFDLKKGYNVMLR